ncbi:hypothetical protein SNE40_002352 [Patella caerulea]|uniref:Uncharacterized protein n=1 Tax=Patella caerulea TaxID=87958 RepID=A0AAN8QE61_PATCE
MGSEPGLMIANSLFSLSRARYNAQIIPILIVNNTNKTFRLKRGCVIGRVLPLYMAYVNSVSDTVRHTPIPTKRVLEDKFATLQVPDGERSNLLSVLKKNHDLFAGNDTELGHTDTVKMTIDTGEHPPIKQRPFPYPNE